MRPVNVAEIRLYKSVDRIIYFSVLLAEINLIDNTGESNFRVGP